MKVFGATEAAAELGVDPRALRRFLRTNASYRNAGMGGRYMFTQAEVTSLKRAYFSAHPQSTKSRVAKVDDPHILDDDPGVPLEKLTPKGLSAADRAARVEARAARQQRLKTRMAEVLSPRYDDEPADLS